MDFENPAFWLIFIPMILFGYIGYYEFLGFLDRWYPGLTFRQALWRLVRGK